MLSTLREICCCSKEENDDNDIQDNSRPVDLPKLQGRAGSSQSAQHRHRPEVALTPKVEQAVHTAGPSNAKLQDHYQQDKAKLIEPAEQDEPDVGEPSKSERISKEGSSRPFDNGLRDSNGVQDGDRKEPANETSNLSKVEPADGGVINGSSTPVKKDLWQMAFDELDENLKEILSPSASKAKLPESVIQEVINRTEETFKAYQNAALKFKKYNGKEINVRDVAGKILKSAIHCSEIVKGVASFDPSGHAASAWGIVSFGLMMTKNNMEQKEAVFESSEFLADILARYTILDHHYRIQGLPSSDGLDSAIVQVYKALLEYSAEVERQRSAGKLNRLGNSIFSASDTDLARLQSVVEEQDRKVSNWSQITHVLHQNTKAAEILAGIESLGRDTEVIKVKVLEGERQRILDWLSDVNFSKFQNDYKILRTGGTGDWLLNSSEYRDWKATPGKFLWLHGPAGCGKSVLCSTVIRDIEETRKAESTVFFSYWYFQHDNQETQDVQAMTRAIIRQLVTQELPKSLLSLWEEHKEHNREPDQDKVLAVLGDVTDCHTGDELFLIFDALDECPELKSRGRDSLFEALRYLRNKPGKKIHILATSRFEEGISRHMTGSLGIDLEQRMHNDVEIFVCDTLINGPLNYWKGVYEEIKEALLSSKERRRFRWADLQLKSLEDCKKKEEILELLGSVPETLEETYRGILKKIRGHKRKNEWKDARSILTWLSFSLQPLSLKSVAAVVGYDRPEDVVTTCTTSLVTVSPSDGTIKLAHFSVKEFLIGSDGVHARDWYQLTTFDGHFDITNCALDTLLKETKALNRESINDKPLFQYAAKYWHKHFLELVDSGCRSLELEDKVASLFQRPIVYLNWQRHMHDSSNMTLWDTNDDSWYSRVTDTPLYLACKMGLQSVVERLLSQGADPFAPFDHPKHSTDIDAFGAAALYGHLAIMKHLLGSFSISAEKAQTIIKTVKLANASPDDIGVFLDVLLSPDHFCDVSAKGCRVLKEDFVIAMAKNRDSSHLLISSVLEMQGKLSISATQRVLQEVAWNSRSGEKSLRILCDKRPEDMQITQEIVRKVVKKQTGKALELLSELHDVEIQVTEELLVAAASNRKGPGALAWLLERIPSIEHATAILRSVAKGKYQPEKLDILFGKFQRAFTIGNEVLYAAIKDGNIDLMRILLRKREEALIFFDLSDILLAVITSSLLCPGVMLDLLIDNTNASVPVSEKILCSAARSTEYASVMKWLWSQSSDVPITEELWVSAAANLHLGEDIIKCLLKLDQNRLITERILISAVCNRGQGPSILSCLLGHDKKLEITEKVLVSAAENSSQAEKLLELIFINFPNAKVTDRVLSAARTNSISVLFRHIRSHGRDYSVRLMDYTSSHRPQMEELLQKGLIELDNDLVAAIGTQEVLRMALGDVHTMTKLLDLQRNDIAVTEEFITEALSMGQMDLDQMDLDRMYLDQMDRVRVNHEAFQILCDRQGLTDLDTANILKVALLNRQYKFSAAFLRENGHNDLQELWNSIYQADGCTLIDIIRSASLLLGYGDFDLFPVLWKTLPSNDNYFLHHELAKLFDAQNLSASSKEMITEIIVGKADAETLHKILINLVESGTPISGESWDALWRNHQLRLAQKVEISKFLLCYGEFDVSQTLLGFLPPEEEYGGFIDEDVNHLFSLCAGPRISPPASEALAKLVFGQGNAYTIQRFIRHNPTFRLTEEPFQLVKRNKYADKDVLMSFFSSIGVPIESLAADDDGAVSDVAEEI
ncbi:hypothetical protein BDV19DRAFT_389361 [Aspergillus venezuelensis]